MNVFNNTNMYVFNTNDTLFLVQTVESTWNGMESTLNSNLQPEKKSTRSNFIHIVVWSVCIMRFEYSYVSDSTRGIVRYLAH